MMYVNDSNGEAAVVSLLGIAVTKGRLLFPRESCQSGDDEMDDKPIGKSSDDVALQVHN
jgi:hypothetical protein